jgi:putative DNA primase/helicase
VIRLFEGNFLGSLDDLAQELGNSPQVPCPRSPPSWLVKAVLVRPTWPGIRELLGVTECPFVLPDGTVVKEAGYHEQTKTIMLRSYQKMAIDESPTKEDARRAVERLYRLLDDFPFRDGDEDKIVWLAALLTAIQRPVIEGPVPGFAINGNKAGTGKGLLINLIGRLAWAADISTMNYPDSATEADKVALSLALGAVQAVHFDNLHQGQSYGNAAIDSALTTTVRGGRILGLSKYVNNVPLRTVWFLSGNNISPGSDAHRRWLPINLETTMENPHERNDLKIRDIKKHVINNRRKLIGYALTILKAHAVAGSPGHGMGPLGSFEDWDALVRAPLSYATGKDCLVTQRKATKESAEHMDKIRLLETWKFACESENRPEGLTVENLLELFDPRRFTEGHPKLVVSQALSALGSSGRPPTSRQIGDKLRSMKNENVGGYKFVENGKSHGAVIWKVENVV